MNEIGETAYLCLSCTSKLKGNAQLNLQPQNGTQQQQQQSIAGNEYKYRYRT